MTKALCLGPGLSARILKSHVRGNSHAWFGSGDEGSDPLTDHNLGGCYSVQPSAIALCRCSIASPFHPVIPILRPGFAHRAKRPHYLPPLCVPKKYELLAR